MTVHPNIVSLKLGRNKFADHLLWDSDGYVIDWSFIKKLVHKQNEAGLKLANKLSTRHLDWKADKMKVSLAVQTLSRSVACSLDHLREDLKV